MIDYHFPFLVAVLVLDSISRTSLLLWSVVFWVQHIYLCLQVWFSPDEGESWHCKTKNYLAKDP